MKLQFDPRQEFQLEAIKAVVDLFRGQKSGLRQSGEYTDGRIASNQNTLSLTEEEIRRNFLEVAARNGLAAESTAALKKMHLPDTQAVAASSILNFSLEMETGTGKTYVYLRTIYELYKTYGYTKFVVVVPSIAIREGVLKTLESTAGHFRELYDNIPAEYWVYHPGRPADLARFAQSENIQILVINIDSFAKDVNIINQVRETGVRPVDYIRAARPVVVLDEPQNMETPNRRSAIAQLNPLVVLRYSATHANRYNLLYRLDPAKAYDMGLVKQIEVDSVLEENQRMNAFVHLRKITAGKERITAALTILGKGKEGGREKAVTVRPGDDLYDLSGEHPIYRDGYIIGEINAAANCLTFSNGRKVYTGDKALSDRVMQQMIDATVEHHFKKEKELMPRGIKVLSVFFIDRVAHYRHYDGNGHPVPGKFAVWFEESFRRWQSKAEFKNLYPFTAGEAHDGYFSQDKGRFKDSREGRPTKADDETFNLIMRDKERLLQQDVPLRFIFSHSALREGWDNPNVFQICTLNETHSEMKKRQEIGRGLRLCVDQTGSRNKERSVNRLTIIANESYEAFSKSLQKEIAQECGIEYGKRIKAARARIKLSLREGWQGHTMFRTLWERLNQQTEYDADFDSGPLIRRCVAGILAMPAIKKPEIIRERYTTHFVSGPGNRNTMISGTRSQSAPSIFSEQQQGVPDIAQQITLATGLTMQSVIHILLQANRLDEVFYNPRQFIGQVAGIIRREAEILQTEAVRYRRVNGAPYDLRMFESTVRDYYTDQLISLKHPEKSISSYALTDNRLDEEVIAALDAHKDVRFFFRLPADFSVPTPAGNYHPQWAVLLSGSPVEVVVAATKAPAAQLEEASASKHFSTLGIQLIAHSEVGTWLQRLATQPS